MSRYNPVWPSVKPWKLDYRSVIGVKPIKGVDYWTEKDQKEIVDEAVRRVEESSSNVSILSDEKSVTIRFGGKDGGI